VLKEKGGLLKGIDIVNLLETINKRIEKLVDRDHMIGHSYFLKVSTLEDLKIVFQNKVIPLLQEYFFGDYGKIGLIIGKVFFEEINNDTNENFFADFDYDASSLLEKPTYHLKNVVEMSDASFIDALNLLLGKEGIENE
jgi:5-methylcytosine-specific restriction protein B